MIPRLRSAPTEEGPCEPPGYRGGMALFIVHLDAAYNLARWLMRDETEAEDMVQEAYVRVASHFTSFRGGDGRAWLLTIVRNSCYDRLRKKGVGSQHRFRRGSTQRRPADPRPGESLAAGGAT